MGCAGEGKMDEGTDLKALEKKAWSSYFQDGLWEIVIGTILLGSTLSSALESAGVEDMTRTAIYLPLMMALPPLIFTLGKKYITVPRLGVAKFGQRRELNLLKLTAAIAATLSVNLLMWGLSTVYPEATRGIYGMALVIFDILAIFCLLGYYMDYNGFYIIAVLMVCPEFIIHLLKNYTSFTYYFVVAYGIPAAILIAIGSVALVRFMRKYDVPMEAADAS
jgi:hypothetical protein